MLPDDHQATFWRTADVEEYIGCDDRSCCCCWWWWWWGGVWRWRLNWVNHVTTLCSLCYTSSLVTWPSHTAHCCANNINLPTYVRVCSVPSFPSNIVSNSPYLRVVLPWPSFALYTPIRFTMWIDGSLMRPGDKDIRSSAVVLQTLSRIKVRHNHLTPTVAIWVHLYFLCQTELSRHL